MILKNVFISILLITSPLMAGSVRAVSTSPQLTELMFQLGRAGELVGTTEYSDYPAEASQIPRVGPVFNPGFEATFAKRPDWVLLDGSVSNPTFTLGLKRMQIPSLELKLQTVDDLFSAAEVLNEKLDRIPKPDLILQLEKKWAGRWKSSQGFSFIAITWMDPPILFGRTSFISHLIEDLGGQSLLPENCSSDFPKLSDEWMIAHPPQVVFYLSQSAGIENAVRRWWPGKKIKLIALNDLHFSRASFTPLIYLEEVTDKLRKPD